MKKPIILAVILLAISFVSGQNSDGYPPPKYLPYVEICPFANRAFLPEEVPMALEIIRNQGCSPHIERASARGNLYMVYGTRIVRQ